MRPATRPTATLCAAALSAALGAAAVLTSSTPALAAQPQTRDEEAAHQVAAVRLATVVAKTVQASSAAHQTPIGATLNSSALDTALGSAARHMVLAGRLGPVQDKLYDAIEVEQGTSSFDQACVSFATNDVAAHWVVVAGPCAEGAPAPGAALRATALEVAQSVTDAAVQAGSSVAAAFAAKPWADQVPANVHVTTRTVWGTPGRSIGAEIEVNDVRACVLIPTDPARRAAADVLPCATSTVWAKAAEQAAYRFAKNVQAESTVDEISINGAIASMGAELAANAHVTAVLDRAAGPRTGDYFDHIEVTKYGVTFVVAFNSNAPGSRFTLVTQGPTLAGL